MKHLKNVHSLFRSFGKHLRNINVVSKATLLKYLSTIILLFFIGTTNLSAQTLIVSDDFENGLASFWGSTPWTDISDELPKDGDYSLRFKFTGVPEGDHCTAEARFDLGAEYTELSIEFDLYIPSNYEHRAGNNGQGWANHKFFRLWKDTYSDSEKIGASMWNEFDNGNSQTGNNTYNSRLSLDYRVTTGTSSTNLTEDFITRANDLGQWMSIVIYIKAGTDATDTEFRFYKNGQLFLEDTFHNNWVPGTQGYQKGYLLGWANGGFTEDTFLYIDNVAFYDGDITSSLSINDEIFNNSISITPNPTSNTFTIDLQNETLEKVIIYNQLGQQIKEVTTKEVNILNLPKGIYIIKITSESGKTAIKKIIKK